MTIATTTSRVSYLGSGSPGPFSYPFKIFANTDLEVTHVDVDGAESTLALTTDYTVAGVGSSAGGSVTLLEDLAVGERLIIRRVRPITQATSVRNQGRFFPEIHEDAFDHQTMVAQQLAEELGRSLRGPVSDDPLGPLPRLRANRYLGFDAAGQPIAIDAAPPVSEPVERSAFEFMPRSVALEVAAGIATPALAGVVTESLQAAVESTRQGERLVLPPGLYPVTGVDLKSQPIEIHGYGARILQTEKGINPFRWTAEWGTSHTITAIETVLVDVNSVKALTKLTLSAAPTDLAPDDIVKVYSEDPIPQARHTTRKVGEFAIVYLVDGTDVYLQGELRDGPLYQTQPRVARLEPGSPELHGLSFTITPEIDTGSSSGNAFDAPVLLIGAVNPLLKDVSVHRSVANAFVFLSCFGYRAVNVRARDLPPGDNSRFGYGICDAQSEYGHVQNLLAINCRHGFTTNTYGAIVEGTPAAYGRSAYTTVADSTAVGGQHAGFDTHDESYAITFDNCRHIRVGARADTSFGEGIGFQSRGDLTVFRGCEAIGARYGFSIMSSSDRTGGNTRSNWSRGVRLENCRTTDTFVALRATRALEVASSGCSWDITPLSDQNNAIVLEGAELDIRGGDLRYRNNRTAAQNANAILLNSDSGEPSILRIDGTLIDISHLAIGDTGVTNYNQRVVRMATADAHRVVMRRSEVIAGDKPLLGLVMNFSSGSQGGRVELEDVVVRAGSGTTLCEDSVSRPKGIGPTSMLISIDAAYGRVRNLRQITDGTVTAAVADSYVNASGSGDLTSQSRWRAGDYTINYSPTSGTTTISNLADGYDVGQLVTIRHNGSSNVLRIPDGGNISLPGDVDIDLTPREACRLIWDGTTWLLHGVVRAGVTDTLVTTSDGTLVFKDGILTSITPP